MRKASGSLHLTLLTACRSATLPPIENRGEPCLLLCLGEIRVRHYLIWGHASCDELAEDSQALLLCSWYIVAGDSIAGQCMRAYTCIIVPATTVFYQ